MPPKVSIVLNSLLTAVLSGSVGALMQAFTDEHFRKAMDAALASRIAGGGAVVGLVLLLVKSPIGGWKAHSVLASTLIGGVLYAGNAIAADPHVFWEAWFTREWTPLALLVLTGMGLSGGNHLRQSPFGSVASPPKTG